MDAVLIVIFFFLTPILIGVFFEIIKDRRKRVVKKILEKAFSQLTRENGLLIVDAEFLKNKVIGIDRRNKKLVYAEFSKGTIDQFCIDLKSLSFCKLRKVVDKFSNQVTHIFIEVKCRGINKIYRLNFYDSSFDKISSKTSSIRKAEQWKSNINLNRRSVSFHNQFEYVL